jgi:hypothetical protein
VLHFDFSSSFCILFVLYFNSSCICTEINANSVESWADDILGAESISEYKAIFQKLGGTESVSRPLMGFGELNDQMIKGLTCLLRSC